MLQTAMDHTISLTDTIFETGAYGVPSKSQNPTVLGQGGLPSNQWWHPGFVSGALCLATIGSLKLDVAHKTKTCFPHWKFDVLPT